MSLTEMGKFLCLILRHKPEIVGISLDEHGWANVKDLIEGINQQCYFDMTTLEKIVVTDNKQRYSFNEDKTKIRANQGHSVDVDVELEEVNPPEYLFHGTGRKYIDSIMKDGLVPKSRLYVHLSDNYNTAINVGMRHGEPVVLCIYAGDMYRDGYKFYRSKNGVWLVKHVPVEYFD
jgi:putative RNA 2'-phosphotransferase